MSEQARNFLDRLVDWFAHVETSAEWRRRRLTQVFPFGHDAPDPFSAEIGRVELALEDVDVVGFITALLERERPNAEAKGIWLKLELGDRLGTVAWDPRRVGQAVAQVVDNAVKFTEQGGVTVTVRRVGDDFDGAVVIDVEDTGAGIAPKMLSQLFDPFGVAQGAGLSRSRALCRRMGGEISVRSRLGQGSCFKLRLPTNFGAKPRMEAFDLFEPSVGLGTELAAA